jgi:hypothetical protein
MTARLGQLLGHHHIEVPPIISRALKRLELPRRYLTDEQLVDLDVGPTGVLPRRRLTDQVGGSEGLALDKVHRWATMAYSKQRDVLARF